MRQSIGRFISGLVLIAGVSAGAGLGAALVAPGVAGATTTFTVNDTADFPVVGGVGGGTTTCTSTNVIDDTNTCTLRAAIQASENLAESTIIDLPDPTGVEFDAGPAYSVESTNGQLDVNDNGNTVTIDGAGQGSTVIEAQCTGVACTVSTRVLKIESGTTADISGVTVEDGDPSGGNGAGILECGIMTLTDSTVTDNTASDSGGGVEVSNGGSATLDDDTVSDNSAGDEGGGGVASDAESTNAQALTLSGTTVTGNTTVGGGGGVLIFGEGTLSDVVTIENDSTVSDNSVADEETGAGIAQETESTLNVTGSTISGNGPTEGENVDIEGGGAYLAGEGSADTFTNNTTSDNQAYDGAGVYVYEVDPTFSGDTISDNTAASDGGGVYLQDGTNTFTGVTIRDNTAPSEGGGAYIADGTNTFSGGSFTDNTADSQGGGIAIEGGTNSFTNETVEDNTAGVAATDNGNGGGIYVDDGTSTFNDDTVNDNNATWVSGDDAYGGGLDVTGESTVTFTGGSLDSNLAYGGGGFAIFSGTINVSQADISSNHVTEGAAGVLLDGGTTSITQSTISNNAVTEEIGITEFVGDGGGIVSDFCNPLTLTNDTIADNSAPLLGGGYFGTACTDPSSDNSTAFLFDTISGNSAGEGGGNINTDDESTLDIGNSIVANGVSGGVEGDNCTFSDGGTLTSHGYNLIDDSTCGTPGTGDIIGQNPQLGALGDNGGPTQTELPAYASPAVGAVPAAVCSANGVGADQRGDARGAGTNGSCTIGSVEVAQAAPPAYNPNGYRLAADEGGVFDFGLNFNGSLVANHLNAPIVGIANSPGPNGYLLVGSDGGVFALGGANFYGSLGGQSLPSPIAAIAATPSEDGYWLASQAGTISHFGNTPSLPAVQLPPGAHIVGMASDNTGKGAWLVDQLGDVYAEGDANYLGGMGGKHINAPVVGISALVSGAGYVLAGSDGGVYNFGVGFYGSVPGSLKVGQSLSAPIVGIALTHSGHGYWLVGSDGGVFNYGDAPFLGSIYTAIPGRHLNGPIVGVQPLGSAPG